MIGHDHARAIATGISFLVFLHHLIAFSLLLTVLGSTVLEPDFYLVDKNERVSHFELTSVECECMLRNSQPRVRNLKTNRLLALRISSA